MNGKFACSDSIFGTCLLSVVEYHFYRHRRHIVCNSKPIEQAHIVVRKIEGFTPSSGSGGSQLIRTSCSVIVDHESTQDMISPKTYQLTRPRSSGKTRVITRNEVRILLTELACDLIPRLIMIGAKSRIWTFRRHKRSYTRISFHISQRSKLGQEQVTNTRS